MFMSEDFSKFPKKLPYQILSTVSFDLPVEYYIFKFLPYVLLNILNNISEF